MDGKRPRDDGAGAGGSAAPPEAAAAAADVDSTRAIRIAVTAQLANWRAEHVFPEALVNVIIQRSRAILMAEPMLLQVSAPVNICGDIHGQLYDLVAIFDAGAPPPTTSYVFLGDYVDRGRNGVECISVLLGLKILYPQHIHLLRGNHEAETITKQYGFFDECKRKFSIRLYKRFVDVFNCLPVAALVESAALCMHGGLSKQLVALDQIHQLERPCVVPDAGLLCDLLWSDPGDHDGWLFSERGVSFSFGEDVVAAMLERLDIDLIVRAHQVMHQGYGFFADRRLVTVFSASNYCGDFFNAAAMLMMDKDLTCSFKIFRPADGRASPRY
jgi:diadenosine tetraphosphatase ApaH/serine/threonine PP2A family protein phosphatase